MEKIANSKGLLHIFEKIFLALDAKTLVNCLLVSRTLSINLKNPRFWFKKACKQHNPIKYFEVWNALFEITDENEPRKEDLIRTLKIICIGERECVKNVLKHFGRYLHPLPLSILCREFQLADYILEKLCDFTERDARGAHIFEQLKLKYFRDVKSFHTFAKMYESFKKEVNNHLMKYGPKLLLRYENDVELFEEYLTIFGDSLQPDKWGDSLLHRAAEKGYINIVRVLASNQHDLDITNANQETPLYIAVQFRKLEIVEFLISKNVNPNIQNVLGNTLLHLAAMSGHVDIMKALIPLFDNLDIQNKYLSTPLALAIKNDNVEIVKLLVSKNVDLNITDKYGLTPFNYAVNNGLYKISKMLKPY